MSTYRIPEQQPHIGGWLWENPLTGETLDWDDVVIGYGPVTDCPQEPDPWESVKPGELYWVTGRDNYRGRDVSGIAFVSAMYDSAVDYLNGDGWEFWRTNRYNRLDSVVPLTAIPTHLLDALIETAVDYDDPEDGTSVSREALHDLTDWLADHPQNTGDSHA